MTIILFLVDTSSSMCQKAYVNGVQKSYLDIAKGAVETFLKYRQRTQDCLGDRYMLLTFEEPPANVKAGWKENHATFINELKNLQSNGLTSMGESLKNAFDLLNLNRMQSGIDTYGQGRCPFYLEPSVIIVITDGGRYSFRGGIHQDIILPLNTQIPGTKFTKEPFRWDQRLFSLVLRMSGNRIDERAEGKVPHDDSPIERMCEVTGGRSYRVRSHHVLNQCIESLVQKVQPGVVLNFEPMIPFKEGIPNDPIQDILFQPTKKMIYVQKHISQKSFPIGFWPLPEPYWPDPKAMTLPPRDAHPKLKVVTPAVDEPQMVRSFPVDKYEVEACPMTLQILQKRELNKCWQVIISSGMHGFEFPFGYLKAAPNFTQVHLYVLPYNYPVLLPLLHDLIHKYNLNPPNELMYKLNSYVRSIPPYYCPFLRKALLNITIPYALLQFILPENADNYLSANVANQLKHIKNTAKQDQENLCMKVYKQLKQPKPPYRQVETVKVNNVTQLRRDLVRHPLLRDTFTKLHSEMEPLENFTIVVPQVVRQTSAKSYRNPFDIPRRDLIDEIERMREAFTRPNAQPVVTKDSGHCLPISEMGNYQEYLKNKDVPLREIEPTNVRQHMFGNPYKKDKHMVMVDEADLSDVAPMKSNNGGVPGSPGMPGLPGVPKKLESSRSRKRKAGPIRKDFIFRRMSKGSRPSSPSLSSAGSSVASMSDFEDDSGSDTSSVSSGMSEDGDPGRLMENFDFSEEEPPEPETHINGYVRNFINGIYDESSCDSEMSGVSVPSMGGALGPPNPMGLMVAGVTASATHPFMSAYSHAPSPMMGPDMPMMPMAGTVPTHPHNNIGAPPGMYLPHQINGGPMASSAMPGGYNMMAAPTPAMITPTGTTPAAVQSNANALYHQPQTLHQHHLVPHHPHHHQNDINDAQEISRILQQCHNGNSVNAENSTTEVKMELETALMPPPPATSGGPGGATTGSNNNAVLSNSFDSLKKETATQAAAGQVVTNNHHSTRSGARVVNHNSHGKNAKLPRRSLSPPPLSEEQRENARKHNLEVREQVFRDIRRPGRNYSLLLEHLGLIKGDYDMKSSFVQMCIAESLRFRRKQMVNSIQEWWDQNKKEHQPPQKQQKQQKQHPQQQVTAKS